MHKDFFRPTTVAVLLSLVAISACGARRLDPAQRIHYVGRGSCFAMDVNVSFTYDPQAREVHDFTAFHACHGQSPSLKWAVEKVVHVDEAGAFYYGDRYGNFVRGTIGSSGEARGELNPGSIQVHCAGVPSDSCTRWIAQSQGPVP